MLEWLARLDVVLRARRPDNDDDAAARAHTTTRLLLALAIGLGVVYGSFMGWYAVRTRGVDGLPQFASSSIKLPLLFLLTLIVTFPSLYVFSTLLGSRLTFQQMLRVVAEWVAVILAVAASLGPILGFFTISTESYLFIVLLNVGLLGLAGLVGCAALVHRLRVAGRRTQESPSEPTPPPGPEDPLRRLEPRVQPRQRGRAGPAAAMLRVWVVIFGVIGLQMAWLMRPFIGAPGEPFTLFRPTERHAFGAIARAAARLIGVE